MSKLSIEFVFVTSTPDNKQMKEILQKYHYPADMTPEQLCDDVCVGCGKPQVYVAFHESKTYCRECYPETSTGKEIPFEDDQHCRVRRISASYKGVTLTLDKGLFETDVVDLFFYTFADALMRFKLVPPSPVPVDS